MPQFEPGRGDILIKREVNGHLVYSFNQNYHTDEKDRDITSCWVYEFENWEDLDKYRRMFEDLSELLGVHYSKHNKKNLYIQVKEEKQE